MKLFVLIAALACLCQAQEYEFPEGFLIGVSSSAYQVEGAWNESGKGESIWDYAAHNFPEIVSDGTNGDIACDTYHKTEEDIELLNTLGVDFYRFSISWSRVLPNGKVDNINSDGIRYYNELIDALLANNIRPVVTMHHFDTPQVLEEEGGFLNLTIADYFADYADVLYENFGDRVKDWITFNEPTIFCDYGYNWGLSPPLVEMMGVGGYICGHNMLVAHAKAYHLYNDNYKDSQGGRVGITFNSDWYEPLSDSVEDIDASELAMQVYLGWVAHPIFSEEGDYPEIMKERIAQLSEEEGYATSRLVELTEEEIDLLRGSADFFGINHYTSSLCTTLDEDDGSIERPSLNYDKGVSCTADSDWEVNASGWPIVPFGFRRLLNWIKNQYNNPDVLVTENGYSDPGNVLNDCRRINYYNTYLTELLNSIYEDACNVIGYAAWTFMDNFEWSSGYTLKFGLYSVDFDGEDRPRTPKMSVPVFSNIIANRRIDWSYTPEGYDECEW